jgi:ribonuclease Z
MFEIIFLGTSASAPSVHRGLSAQVVLVKDQLFLIDQASAHSASLARDRLRGSAVC